MIFTIIGILIIFYGFHNLKRGFLCFLVYKIFLVTNITLISMPGVPLLSLDMFMIMAYAGLFFVKRNSIEYTPVPFPYKIPFLLLMSSWTISTLFAYVGFNSAVSALIGSICQDIVMIWLLWIFVEDEDDFRFLLKWFTAAFFITCIYGYFEKLTLSNPLMEYEISLVGDDERALNFSYEGEKVRGGWRVQSVFAHAIGAGINWGMFIIWTFILTYILQFKSSDLKTAIIISLLCIPCILFSNSRSPLVFLFVGSLAFVNFKNKNFNTAVIVGVILLFVIGPYFSDYLDNIMSLVDSDAQAKVGGSDSEMRMEQLAASVAIMNMSPIFGLGYKFMNEMTLGIVDDLLGLESMWFRIMTQFGYIGIIVNLIFAYYSLVIIPRKYHSRQIFFLSLAYWITNTITSTPGMLTYMYYLIIFMCIKMSTTYIAKRNELLQTNPTC